MGKVFADKPKSTIKDFYRHQRRLRSLLQFAFTNYFVKFFFDYANDGDMQQRSHAQSSMVDCIRLGRNSNNFTENYDRGLSPQASHARIIPIKVESQNEKNSHRQLKNRMKDAPIILDDDLHEIIDITSNSMTDSAETSTPCSAKDTLADGHKPAIRNTLTDKKRTQSLVTVEDEDLYNHKSVYVDSLSKLNTEHHSQISEDGILDLIVLDDKCKSDNDSHPSKGTNQFKDHSSNKDNCGKICGVDILDLPTLSSSSVLLGQSVMKEGNSELLVDELEKLLSPISPVYEMLTIKLAKENRRLNYITGDGNCFFRAVSKTLYGCEKYHKAVRQIVIDVIATNKSKFAQFVDGDVQDHVEKMSQDHCWATTCEIYAAATALQRDIFMLTPDHLNKNYSWLLFKPVFEIMQQQCEFATHRCYITLCNTNGNHYDQVVADHGNCNCFLPQPELGGVSTCIDLT